MNMISLKNISISFNGRELFSDFSLVVRKGEKIALKGRSGSGKSTLLNIIMGFQLPDNGIVKIDNNQLSHDTVRELRRKIAWLPQNHNSIGMGNVGNIINYPFGFSENKDIIPSNTDIDNAVAKLNLAPDTLSKKFEELSGGERQRIGLIIAKLLRRPIILLDEPTSALDKDSLARAAEFIMKDKELTVVSASHDDEWLKYCNRIIELQT